MRTPEPSVEVIVAIGLIVIAWTGVAGLIWLVGQYEVQSEVISYLVAPSSAALGALGALLAGRAGDKRKDDD